ncbi:unnamed protein product [Phaeothamnion confervicola]
MGEHEEGGRSEEAGLHRLAKLLSVTKADNAKALRELKVISAQLEQRTDELSHTKSLCHQLKLENAKKWRLEERDDWRALVTSIQADREALHEETATLRKALALLAQHAVASGGHGLKGTVLTAASTTTDEAMANSLREAFIVGAAALEGDPLAPRSEGTLSPAAAAVAAATATAASGGAGSLCPTCQQDAVSMRLRMQQADVLRAMLETDCREKEREILRLRAELRKTRAPGTAAITGDAEDGSGGGGGGGGLRSTLRLSWLWRSRPTSRLSSISLPQTV